MNPVTYRLQLYYTPSTRNSRGIAKLLRVVVFEVACMIAELKPCSDEARKDMLTAYAFWNAEWSSDWICLWKDGWFVWLIRMHWQSSTASEEVV